MKVSFAVFLASSLIVSVAAAAPTPAPAPTRDESFHLRSGDRVVFYGDSITDARMYSTFVETFVLTRFPELNVRFVHSGWGGDRVTGGGGGSVELRLRRDVIAHDPTVVTIMLGMNDGRYKPFDQEVYDTYASGYQRMFSLARAALPKARFTLIQPSPYDEITRPSPIAPNAKPGGLYNDVLVKFGAFVKSLAARERVGVADFNGDLSAVLKKATALDKELAQKIIPDRVHPAASGHLVMAGSLLAAWNAPALVASVEIDGATGRLVRARNAAVSGLVKAKAKSPAGLSWTQIDRALPMPIDMTDPAMGLALRASTFIEKLNQQPLEVRGLGAGTFALRIDGEQVGVFRGADLAKGINLATLPTPMVRQAAEVHGLTMKHNEIHFARWRAVELKLDPGDTSETAAALAALDKLEEALIEKQRREARPRARRFEIAAVPEIAAAVPPGFTPIFGAGTLGHVLLDPRWLKSAEVFFEVAGACDGAAALLLRARPNGDAYRVSLDCREGGSFGRIDAVGFTGVKAKAAPTWAERWKKDAWNSVRVRIEGHAPHIQVWLNGDPLGEVRADNREAYGGADLEGEAKGLLAIQLPTEPGAKAPSFRNVSVKTP